MPWKTFKLQKEAHVSQHYSEQSFPHGDQGILYISRFQEDGDAYRTYMSFDVKGKRPWKKVSPARPAFLRLFIYRNEIVSGAINCSLYPLAEPWHPAVLNWNRQPSCKPNGHVNFAIPSGWQGYFLLDLSRQVREWLEDEPNYGFMIKGDEQKSCLVAFHGASYPFPGTVPTLLIGTH